MSGWIRRSFRRRTFVTVLLVALVPLILCDLVMMQLQVSRAERDLRQSAEAELQRLSQQFDTELEQMEDVLRHLSTSTIIRSALRRGRSDSKTAYQELYRDAKNLHASGFFGICDAAGNCAYATDAELLSGSMNPDWGVLRSSRNVAGIAVGIGRDHALEAACAVKTSEGTVLGYVVFAMEYEHFDHILNYSGTGDLLLVDRTWNGLYSTRPNQAQRLAAELKERIMTGQSLDDRGSDYHYYSMPCGSRGFTLLLQLPRSFSGAVLESIFSLAVIMGILTLVLCGLAAWILSRHLSRPITLLNRAMGRVEQGDYAVQIRNDRLDELGTLAESFNRMTEKYRANVERSVARQRELNETQIRMMQAQLNPHFLYNTLDTMKWMGLTHQAPEIASLATSLAQILRTSISEEELIPLEQELDMIDRYVDIQLIRFQNSFACEIEVEDRFQSCLIPKMTLQPLVENAIGHGVRGREEGYIKLSASQEGNDLLLKVSDNGVGMSPEILERLNSADKRIPGGHLGLYNADKIIGLHFGPGYGLSAESTPGEGSVVTLRLPMIRKEALC